MENYSEETSMATTAKNRNAKVSCGGLSSPPTLSALAFDLLTETEAAARLRISRRKLAQIRKSGGISFLKTPCIMYREHHLQEYLDNCEVKAAPQPKARYGYRSAGIHSDNNYQALAGIV